MEQITWGEFEKVELRVGTVIKVEDFPEAKKPSYRMWIDFGQGIGTRKSSGQYTKLYKKEELIGKQVLCCINFPPKQVATFVSECLTCGFVGENGEVILAIPERKVKNGSKLA
jgi:tRNA-binding protein